MDPEKSMLKAFIEEGWVIPLIGATAMIARILSSNTKLTVLELVKKITTAAIASGIAWFVLEQTDISSLYKAITYGIIGVISPEIIGGIVKIGQRFSKNPAAFLPLNKEDK
jgi:hypothetical protein